MYNKKQITIALKKQLAIDFNCTMEDFDKKENIITVAKDNPGRRIYTQQKEFLSMVTLGSNTVISAEESIHKWLKQWSAEKNGIGLFEHNNLIELETELKKYGKKLWQSHHMFLPKMEIHEPRIDFEPKWFEQEALMKLYGKREFSNALCESYMPQRPFFLPVAAATARLNCPFRSWKNTLAFHPGLTYAKVGTNNQAIIYLSIVSISTQAG